MEFKVEASRRSKVFIEALLPSIIQQLKLENSNKVLVVRVANECGDNQGATVDLGFGLGYVVILRPTRSLKDLGLTLAHEMVHVKQLARGTLKTRATGSYVWAGRRFGKQTAYLSMPWEIEAFSRQELIFRRALEV